MTRSTVAPTPSEVKIHDQERRDRERKRREEERNPAKRAAVTDEVRAEIIADFLKYQNTKKKHVPVDVGDDSSDQASHNYDHNETNEDGERWEIQGPYNKKRRK